MPVEKFEQLYSLDRFTNYTVGVEMKLHHIVELACILLGVPIVFIAIRDGKNVKLTIKVGTDIDQIQNLELECFEKALEKWSVNSDFSFAESGIPSPLLDIFPNAKFIRVLPLITNDNNRIGHLVIVSDVKREFNGSERNMIRVLGDSIMHVIELEISVALLKNELKLDSKPLRHKLSFLRGSTCYMHFTRDLIVVTYNEKMKRILCTIYNVNVFKGMNVNQILTGRELEHFRLHFEEVLNGNAVQYIQRVKIRWKTTYYKLLLKPNYDEIGVIQSVSYYATDVTKQEADELQIINQQKKLNDIAFIHSHELRKPVATILGLINVFRLQKTPPNEDEILMLENAAKELDAKIKKVIYLADDPD